MLVGIRCCSRRLHPVSFVCLTGHWERGRGFVHTLDDRYFVNTDSFKDAILLVCDDFRRYLHYFNGQGFGFLSFFDVSSVFFDVAGAILSK